MATVLTLVNSIMCCGLRSGGRCHLRNGHGSMRLIASPSTAGGASSIAVPNKGIGRGGVRGSRQRR